MPHRTQDRNHLDNPTFWRRDVVRVQPAEDEPMPLITVEGKKIPMNRLSDALKKRGFREE